MLADPVTPAPVLPASRDELAQIRDIRLVVSDDLIMEEQSETAVTVANIALATRVRLSRSAYRFLRAFDSPCRIEERLSDDQLIQLLPQLKLLISKHMLINADVPASASPAKIRTAVAYKFCGAPAFVAADRPNFVILGIPYDQSADIDSRLVPDLIRQKSLDFAYRQAIVDGRPRGWFDADREDWILQGASFGDAGNVHIEYGESRDRLFARIGCALQQCLSEPSIPLCLGGARSVTRAIVDGMRRDRPVTVVQITSDPMGAVAEGVGDRLADFGHVERVVTLSGKSANGVFGSNEAPSGISSGCRQHNVEQICAPTESRRAVYLSIDLESVAISCCGPAISEPGPMLDELKSTILQIGSNQEIVGIDLVGLDMRARRAQLVAGIACQLALTAMSAAYD